MEMFQFSKGEEYLVKVPTSMIVIGPRPSQGSQTEEKVHGERPWALKMKLVGYQPVKITRVCFAGVICLMKLICLQT